jgi:glutaredoxin
MANEIQVYGAAWCGLTRGLREYLTTSRLPYDYFDIERDAQAEEFMLAMNNGLRRFPVVVVNERVMLEPTVVTLQRVLGEHGIRPAAGRVRSRRDVI